MRIVLDQIYDHIDQHFDEHLVATQRYLRQPSISTQNVGIQECAEMTACTAGFVCGTGPELGHSFTRRHLLLAFRPFA